MKMLLIFWSSFFLCYTASAQLKVHWQRTAGGDYMDAIVKTFELEDGNLLALGYRTPGGNDKSNYWLLYFDQKGNLLREKQLLGPAAEYLIDAERGVDGSITLLGAVIKDTKQYAELLSINTKGEVLWNVKLQSSESCILYDFTPTADGGFMLAGQVTRNGNLETWLSKTDGKGKQIWAKRYGDRLNDGLRAVAQGPDGNFIAVGFVERQDQKSDLQLIKVANNGKLLWRKRFAQAQGATKMISLRDSSFVIGGYTFGETLSDGDAFLLNIDGEGELKWSLQLGEDTAGREKIDAILELPTGDVVAAVGGNMPGSDLQVTQLLAVDSSGRQLWSQYLSPQRRLYTNELSLQRDSTVLVYGSDASPDGPNVDGFLTAFSILDRPRLLWAETYGDSARSTAADIMPYRGGYLILGKAEQESESKIQLLYTNAGGVVEWRRLLEGGAIEEPLQLLPSKGNSFLLLSYSKKGSQNVHLRKINRKGELLWKKDLGEEEIFRSIQALSDGKGGLLLMSADAKGDSSELALRALDVEGRVRWRKTYKTIKAGAVKSICQTAEGHYWLLGYEIAQAGAQWPWLICLNAEGEVQWQRDLVDLKGLRPASLQAFPDSSVVLLGNHLKTPLDRELPELATVELVRLDVNGEQQWWQSYRRRIVGQPQALLPQTEGQSWLLVNKNEEVLLYKLDADGEILDQQDWSSWGLSKGQRLLNHAERGLLLLGWYDVDPIRQTDMRLLRLR